MAIINCKDKRSGITYVYESESYWDKEKQQPRSHRRLIGKLDEATGEIVPTGKRGRRRNSNPSDVTSEIQMIKIEEYRYYSQPRKNEFSGLFNIQNDA